MTRGAAGRATVPVAAKHVCWSYDDPAALEQCARDYLDAGLAAGERVWYARAGGPAGLAGWLSHAARSDAAAARFVPLETAYPSGRVVDPAGQVAVYAAATEEAVAAGYTGLRVLADATSLVRTRVQLDAFARYESLIDRYLTGAPMRAVCAYDRSTLGDHVVAEVACLHPTTNADVLFSLSADPRGGPGTVLAGELDQSADDLLLDTLDRADTHADDGELHLDAADLRFVDHRSLSHLQHHAERRDITVVLHTPLDCAARLVEILGLSRVRVEADR